MAKNPNPDVFMHTTGVYDVSGLWAYVRARPGRFRPVFLPFSDPRHARLVEHVREDYGWDAEHMASLTPERLKVPLLVCVQENGLAVLVDGTHRLLRLHADGRAGFRAYIIPASVTARFRAGGNE